MITHDEINNLVTEWGLRDDVIEKDYVIGWVLWGIGTEPALKTTWAFKGGTCLKKCYVETWRFSEDLDFSVLPGGPLKPEEIEPLIAKILERIYENSGIVFNIQKPAYKYLEEKNYIQGIIYYQGPRKAPTPVRIKLDISGAEKVIRPSVLRKISHPYSDKLPDQSEVRCYAFDEVFAEKLRAMGERSRPRDLYDIVLLYRRQDLQPAPEFIRDILAKKCETKGVPFPSYEAINTPVIKAELESEWGNMLGHQLPALPPMEEYWAELPNIFNWLNGVSKSAKMASISAGKNDDSTWAPPPTIWNWGTGIPLESVRFAAANRLCVNLGYDGTVRMIEPYSLRRMKDGNLLLYGVKHLSGEIRAYRVDRIQSIQVTNTVFISKYNIEFSI